MTRLFALLAAAAIATPALAVNANGVLGQYDEARPDAMNIQMPQELQAVLEQAALSQDEKYWDITIHWTSIYGIDWCMSLEFETPGWTVYDGNITGTICDSGYWAPTAITPLGNNCYQVNFDHVGSGSCADTLCMVGCKVGNLIPDADYGWWGSCTDFPADGAINGCE